MAKGVDNEVNTVTIKVLPFFKHAPETWFAHLEAQFNIKKLTTSSTKFYYCISALPSDVSAHLKHMIRDPGDDPYQEIKDRLMIYGYPAFFGIRYPARLAGDPL